MSEYKTQSELIILAIHGIENNIQPLEYGIHEYPEEIRTRLIGEYFYCGLALDGQLILTEGQSNELLGQFNLSVHIEEDDVKYFSKMSEEDLKRLHKMSFFVECHGDYNYTEEDDNDDENYTFHLLG